MKIAELVRKTFINSLKTTINTSDIGRKVGTIDVGKAVVRKIMEP